MIEKRRSKIEGAGVFATQPIPKNKRIDTYDGEKTNNHERLKRETSYRNKEHCRDTKLTRHYGRHAAAGRPSARPTHHTRQPPPHAQQPDRARAGHHPTPQG